MDCFIGVDVGTSSVKSLLMRGDGTILGTAQRKYDVLRPASGFAEQPADLLWKAASETLRQLSAEYPQAIRQVKCVGYSGQMHALILLDQQNRPLRNAIIWEDQRSVQEIDEVFGVISPKDFCNITLN